MPRTRCWRRGAAGPRRRRSRSQSRWRAPSVELDPPCRCQCLGTDTPSHSAVSIVVWTLTLRSFARRFSANGLDTAGACPITKGEPGALKSNGQSCYWVRVSNGVLCHPTTPPDSAHSLSVDARWCVLGVQFSNGCTIGCPECDGSSDHYGHGSDGTPMPSFIYTGPKPIPPWSAPPGTMVLDPTKPRPVPRSICGNRRTTNATICDPRLRTINVQAECGSSDDIFYFSPWRAPGSAPVIDSWCVA